MGADLLVHPMWTAPDATLDWPAGLEVIDCLTVDRAETLADAWPASLDDAEDAEPDGVALRQAVQEYARGLVETMRLHFEEGSRVLASFSTPDSRWHLWLTGGMSWGDAPNELWEAINDLWEIPEVFTAIGFHVPPTDAELETT